MEERSPRMPGAVAARASEDRHAEPGPAARRLPSARDRPPARSGARDDAVRSWGFVVPLVLSLLSAPAAFGGEVAPPGRTRPPTLAGTWYPEGRARLVSAAHFLMRLAAPGPSLPARPVVLVVPHAAWNYSGLAAAAAYRLLRPGDFDRVVVVAPSHHGAFRGYALDRAAAYRTPLGEIPLCAGARTALESDVARVVPGVADPEYAIEVELPFLQTALGRFCLVPVLAGDTREADEKAFAERLATLHDGRTLFVFSTDFAHYGPRFGFAPFGELSASTRERIRALDDRAIALLRAADPPGFRSYLRETGNTICGRHGLTTMLELLRRIGPDMRAALLAHYASADLPGVTDDSSVTYVALAFVPSTTGNGVASAPPPGEPVVAVPSPETASAETPTLEDDVGARLVQLARSALRSELTGANDLDRELADWPSGPEHERRQGVYVALNRLRPEEIRAHGRLRGCVGQTDPTFPLYYGTVQAALDAARDPRFERVTAPELETLEVEVTVLSPRRLVGSWRDIRLGTHGIVLEKDGRGAVFLPYVPIEHGWTLEQTLEALAQKAGLPSGAWRDGAQLTVFTGQVFRETR